MSLLKNFLCFLVIVLILYLLLPSCLYLIKGGVTKKEIQKQYQENLEKDKKLSEEIDKIKEERKEYELKVKKRIEKDKILREFLELKILDSRKQLNTVDYEGAQGGVLDNLRSRITSKFRKESNTASNTASTTDFGEYMSKKLLILKELPELETELRELKEHIADMNRLEKEILKDYQEEIEQKEILREEIKNKNDNIIKDMRYRIILYYPIMGTDEITWKEYASTSIPMENEKVETFKVENNINKQDSLYIQNDSGLEEMKNERFILYYIRGNGRDNHIYVYPTKSYTRDNNTIRDEEIKKIKNQTAQKRKETSIHISRNDGPKGEINYIPTRSVGDVKRNLNITNELLYIKNIEMIDDKPLSAYIIEGKENFITVE